MVKILIPQDKKQKTIIRGIWLNDNRKLFYDYLITEDFINPSNYYRQLFFYNYLDKLMVRHSQECLFYTHNGQGIIYYNRHKITILKNCLNYTIPQGQLLKHKSMLRYLLKRYNGLTITYDKNNNRYNITVYY